MTNYYIDFDSGNDASDGLSTGNAWLTLGKYISSTRVAGDVATIRRGTSETISADGSPLSDGNSNLPITVEADFDDSWTDFSNSAQTFTPVWGSKTMEASATITGISAGAWIYNSTDGDNPREWSYEVASVSGTTLTLYLPFKGSEGSTKTLKVMPASPIWNDTTAARSMALLSDGFWYWQGIQFKSSDANGIIDISGSSSINTWKDCTFSNTTNEGIRFVATNFKGYILKCRFFSCKYALDAGNNGMTELDIWDCHFTKGHTSFAIRTIVSNSVIRIKECEFSGYENGSEAFGMNYTSYVHGSNAKWLVRNTTVSNSTYTMDYAVGARAGGDEVYWEDFNGTVGDSRAMVNRFGTTANSETAVIMSATSSTVRAGGGDWSAVILPSTNGLGVREAELFEILEYPIYLTAASTTITFFFKSDNITQWTANPTAAELFIELEYWATATRRKVIRSTGTVDFKTDTDFDQSISITATPFQAGVGYVRVKYGKDKEAGTNKFYVDIKPVIS